ARCWYGNGHANAPRHRGRRIHRVELRPPRPGAHRRARGRLRQPDLCGQPREPEGRRLRPALHIRPGRHHRPRGRRRGAGRPSPIVNFAAETHVDRSIDGPRAFVTTNVVGTFELLDAARRYAADLDAASRAAFRFLHVSTDEVYGSLGPTGLFSEDTAYAPNSPYAASKAAADHLVRAYHETYRLPTLLTNCSNNYGPYQYPEKLIPLMTLNEIEGRPLPLYGDGGNVRDWLHVEDHCAALLLVLRAGAPGGKYNV